ncbi:MAG TPA: hypothetical protein VG406_06240 [Isosphaeraceae bacterium]|jgi:tetratricopeptide (TPR) repeat protein|nr:hypothetical protein [Isosphaeraceae bacterium]
MNRKYGWIVLCVVGTLSVGLPRLVARQGGDDVATMRKADMEERSRALEQQGQKDRARDLRRRWLDEQRRNKLAADDAEGRISIGKLYEALVDDPATAASLYQEALTIDPRSQSALDALAALGYKKVGNRWEGPAAAAPPTKPQAIPADDFDAVGSLRGLPPAQVRARFGGPPGAVVRVATRGQLIEQWIYRGGPGAPTQYINFLQEAGSPTPAVIAHYSLP